MNERQKLTFTFVDIAKIKRIQPQSAVNTARYGRFNPKDLSSLIRYVYADMIKELKQNRDFWKARAQKGEEE